MDLQERRPLVFECLDRPNGFKLSLALSQRTATRVRTELLTAVE
jgi:hypothetical protein